MGAGNGRVPDDAEVERATMNNEREEPSVRPGSNHDWEADNSVHEDPDDPKTAAGFLHRILRKVGAIEVEFANSKEDRREMQRAITTNSNANRAVQTALEAQGRTLEQFATEMRGTLAGIARTHASLAADLLPILEARKFWSSVQGYVTKAGITVGTVLAAIGGAIKIYETLKGH